MIDSVEQPDQPVRDDDRLKAWKEIAGYLHTSVRTSQRWEQTMRLPVHRLGSAAGSIVYSSRSELDAWMQSQDGRAAMASITGSAQVPGEPHAETESSRSGESTGRKATRSVGQTAFSGRRTRWLVLAALVVVLVGGWIGVSRWTGQSIPPAQPSFVELRVEAIGGKVSSVYAPIGGMATIGIGGRATYTLSAQLKGEDAEVMLTWVEPDDAAASRPPHAANFTLRAGVRAPLEGLPGLVAIEWVRR